MTLGLVNRRQKYQYYKHAMLVKIALSFFGTQSKIVVLWIQIFRKASIFFPQWCISLHNYKTILYIKDESVVDGKIQYFAKNLRFC